MWQILNDIATLVGVAIFISVLALAAFICAIALFLVILIIAPVFIAILFIGLLANLIER